MLAEHTGWTRVPSAAASWFEKWGTHLVTFEPDSFDRVTAVFDSFPTDQLDELAYFTELPPTVDGRDTYAGDVDVPAEALEWLSMWGQHLVNAEPDGFGDVLVAFTSLPFDLLCDVHNTDRPEDRPT